MVMKDCGERLCQWREDLLVWQHLCHIASTCPCVIHTGAVSVDEYVLTCTERPADCCVFVPRMFSSNKDALDHVRAVWGEGSQKFSPKDTDLAVEVIIRAGWLMKRMYDPSTDSVSLEMFDDDEKRFVPVFYATGLWSVGWELMRMLMRCVQSSSNQKHFVQTLKIMTDKYVGPTTVMVDTPDTLPRPSEPSGPVTEFIEWLDSKGALDGETVPYLPRTVMYPLYSLWAGQEFPDQTPYTARKFWLAVEPLLRERGYTLPLTDSGRKKTYAYESFRRGQGAGFEKAITADTLTTIPPDIFDSRGRERKTEVYVFTLD